MHTRISLFLALAASLLACTSAQAQTPKDAPHVPTSLTVSEKDNEGSITLYDSDTLNVRLFANESTGYSWNVITGTDDPLQMYGYSRSGRKPPQPGVVGFPTTMEYTFNVKFGRDEARTFYLRLLSLRPFDKGIKNAKLWEIKVTIPPRADRTQPLRF